MPKPVAKPRNAKPGAKPGAKLWESGDEESEESDDDDDNDDEDDLEDGVYIVEAILAERADGPKARQYLVQWKGFEGEDTWEPLSMLKENSVFQAYMNENRKKVAPAKLPAAEPRAAEPPAAEPPAAKPLAAEPPAAKRKPPAAKRKPPAAKRKPPAAEPPAAEPPAAKRATAAKRTAAKKTAADAAKPLATWEPTPGAPTPSSLGHVHVGVHGWGSSHDPKAIPTGWPNGWPPSAWGAMYRRNATDPAPDPTPDPAEDPAPDLAEGLAAPQSLSFAMDPLSPTALSNLELEPAAPSNLIAPVAHEQAADEQPTKRQRKGSTKRIAHIELDAEDGPPQIRMLPLEAGPFAGVWIADGEEFEIIGALINDSKAGEIYQQVMYRCTSGYIKSKYIRYKN